MQHATPTVIAVLALELAPAAAFGFAGERVTRAISQWPRLLRLFIPALLALPYAVLGLQQHSLRWQWMALYLLLPVIVAGLLMQASVADPEQRGNCRDALVLLTLGVAVDLRWFDSAGLKDFAGWVICCCWMSDYTVFSASAASEARALIFVFAGAIGISDCGNSYSSRRR